MEPSLRNSAIANRDVLYSAASRTICYPRHCMFATSCRPGTRPGSAGVSLLSPHFACGPAFQRYWLGPTPVLHRIPVKRIACTSPLSVTHSDDHEKQQELPPQVRQTAREPYLEVGSIITTHGVRGEVKVQALTDFPEERLSIPGVR